MEWLGAAINLTAWRHRFNCVDVAGMPWIEIDFPEDLERAREIVWPAIESLRQAELPLVGHGRPRRWSRTAFAREAGSVLHASTAQAAAR